ncbi:platelet endothelial aggregation receptor 1-like [Haliotis rubra]|uniref:platelet endothelial aggregation receptor 1-like n=1 Tax=Haliotis rubra TaxID=36100 RepID=UPI001EE52EB6|nr:platelet endothelial aggregation receptor 1-like [Haliotis rubra]XP_046560906.1 platelet endothelial aggregation receptor 1-like [Haliotis rubra]
MAMWMRIYGTVVFLCYLTVQGEEVCEPGKYGDGCSQNCSQNCHPLPNGIVLCDKETGECFEGCKVGVYGDQCDEPCGKHCLGNICNQYNGHCTLGCIENHIGVFCEIYNGITIVHQGTTSSSHTTVTPGVVPTCSCQVIIQVVTVLNLILVGAVVIFIWRRRKRKKKKSGLYLADGQGFLTGMSNTEKYYYLVSKLLHPGYNTHHCSGVKTSAICSIRHCTINTTRSITKAGNG